jgi:hypothetical protein
VFPNPARPMEVPAVACDTAPNASTAPLLVFIGSRCGLLNASNAFGCAWDNVKQARMLLYVRVSYVSRALMRLPPLLFARQAFVGAGCAASGEPTQCACRHVRLARVALPACLLA